MKVVILQPMFFPWIGVFEQIKRSDLYVHYDDVQFPKGISRKIFLNRIQIKASSGVKWLTVPVLRKGTQLINQVIIDDSQDWRSKHLKTLRQNYSRAPYSEDMFDIVQTAYSLKTDRLSKLNIFIIEKISQYFGISTEFKISSDHNIKGFSSERVLEYVLKFNGTVYITGHGAFNYLDHELFERKNIRVEYMDYNRTLYPQLYGEFDPHISILDLIANCGQDGRKLINSDTKYWKEFTAEGK